MDYSEIFSVLSDLNRLRIFQLLHLKPLCVCEIETLLELTQSNVSRHLNRLKQAGLVSFSKDGQWIHYASRGGLKDEAPELLSLLERVFKESDICREDAEHFLSYEAQALTCRDIKRDSVAVKQLIMGGITNGEQK